MPQKRLSQGDYTVGWISALPTELAAGIQVMDECHAPIPGVPTDTNIYSLGCIGEHNVVAACLPAGRLGTSSAATVASQMRTSFPFLRFGLMVGIAGGVPTNENPIRLGDVVISKPQGEHGGVIQYDFGKALPGRFTRTGSLNAPPNILLAAASMMEANYQLGQTRVMDRLSAFDGRDIFQFPGPEHDIFFNATYNHTGGSDCSNCRRDQGRIRDPTRRGVSLFFGTIASGNECIKDGMTRDNYSHTLGGVLCFEMEAAGLMNNFPCLVIRGICDYADSHKNKVWQPYAAATAAACAKDLLSLIPPLDVKGTSLVPRAEHAEVSPPADVPIPANQFEEADRALSSAHIALTIAGDMLVHMDRGARRDVGKRLKQTGELLTRAGENIRDTWRELSADGELEDAGGALKDAGGALRDAGEALRDGELEEGKKQLREAGRQLRETGKQLREANKQLGLAGKALPDAGIVALRDAGGALRSTGQAFARVVSVRDTRYAATLMNAGELLTTIAPGESPRP
ncbi:hypothetical protein MRS44_018303 [Fusarium solani]|uniref:uncharacterized protein n=1 Tax=Fusarium solani TaxID=169388 RepID=UPI0032C3E7FD|nr:hypothetical protein MRS44_018303 [Fusarium solani]